MNFTLNAYPLAFDSPTLGKRLNIGVVQYFNMRREVARNGVLKKSLCETLPQRFFSKAWKAPLEWEMEKIQLKLGTKHNRTQDVGESESRLFTKDDNSTWSYP